jgi:coenzyme PQQ precursor peptide PqqA
MSEQQILNRTDHVSEQRSSGWRAPGYEVIVTSLEVTMYFSSKP